MCIRDALVIAWCLSRRHAERRKRDCAAWLGCMFCLGNGLHYLVRIEGYRLGRRYDRRVWRYPNPLALPTYARHWITGLRLSILR